MSSLADLTDFLIHGHWTGPGEFYFCPVCSAPIEMSRFDGSCKCWHCGRAVKAAHDCYDDGDCDDYAVPSEDS